MPACICSGFRALLLLLLPLLLPVHLQTAHQASGQPDSRHQSVCLHLLRFPCVAAAAAAAAACPPADFPIKHPLNGLPCTLQRLAA
jgi:hypothetical protein